MGEATKRIACWSKIHWQCLRIRQQFRRRFKKRMSFIFSLLITYLLTIGLTVGAIVIQVDSQNSARLNYSEDAKGDNQDPGHTIPAIDIGTNGETSVDNADIKEAKSFEFYDCTGLSTEMFVAAKMLETLVPTAITFSGTILILQTDPIKKRSLTVWLFVVIALLVVGGIVLPTAKTIEFLEMYLWVLGALCMLSLLLSWHAFSDPYVEEAQHKQESCDGKMVF